MAKGMDSIISLCNVASAQEVPFGIPQYVECILIDLILPVSSFVFHSSLLTRKSVNFGGS